MIPLADRVNLSGQGWDHRLDTAEEPSSSEAIRPQQRYKGSAWVNKDFCKELTPSQAWDKTHVGFAHQVWFVALVCFPSVRKRRCLCLLDTDWAGDPASPSPPPGSFFPSAHYREFAPPGDVPNIHFWKHLKIQTTKHNIRILWLPVTACGMS